MPPSFIPTTKLQVTGRKFLVSRLNHALTRHDTSMRHDPERSTMMALMVGCALVALVSLGALALAYFKPQGLRHDAPIVQSRESLELFVEIDGKLHPAMNLVSARLIAGRPDEPALVKASEVNNAPRGQLVGIPGAPGRVFQPPQSDGVWAVCDIAENPGMSNPGLQTAVIGSDQQQILSQDESAARIVQGPDGATWLLHGGQRNRLDVADTALVTGLGLTRFPVIDTITTELFNAIPAGKPIGVPPIPGAGSPTAYPLAAGVVIGSAFKVADTGGDQWYVALPDGVQQISPVVASVLRNINTYGAPEARSVSPDAVARVPAANPGLDLSAFPQTELRSVSVQDAPVTCWQWIKRAGEQQASSTLAFVPALPLSEPQRQVWRHDLVSRPGMAMYAPPGSGFFVQTTGGVDPRSPAAETQFWLSDAGVRYGLAAATNETPAAAASLGLTTPVPVPWPVLAGLAAGPQLSKQDALVAHDTLAADPAAQSLEGTR